MIARRGGLGGPGGLDPLLVMGLLILLLAFFNGTLIGPVRNAGRDPTGFVFWIIAIVLGITVHEFMHAYAAHRLGDDTARLLGRLSLNPMAHLDPFGTLLLVLAGFGYGKPVPFNESRLRGSLAVSAVALAGPLANFALAALCAIPVRFGSAVAVGDLYDVLLRTIVFWNCILGLFNLVPIPPLDGANIVYGLLPPRQQFTWNTYRQYGPVLLLLLLVFASGFLGALVFGPAQQIYRYLVGG